MTLAQEPDQVIELIGVGEEGTPLWLTVTGLVVGPLVAATASYLLAWREARRSLAEMSEQHRLAIEALVAGHEHSMEQLGQQARLSFGYKVHDSVIEDLRHLSMEATLQQGAIALMELTDLDQWGDGPHESLRALAHARPKVSACRAKATAAGATSTAQTLDQALSRLFDLDEAASKFFFDASNLTASDSTVAARAAAHVWRDLGDLVNDASEAFSLEISGGEPLG